MLVDGDAGESQGEGPAADSGEEVALSKPGKIGCSYEEDGAVIYVPLRELARRDEVAEPLRGEGVELVVVRIHAASPLTFVWRRAILTA